MTPVSLRPSRSRRRAGLAALAALALAVPTPLMAKPTRAAASAGLQEVMFVGNNWEGTADVIRSRGDYAKLGRINV
ncbi:YncE family protein, partial [Micromonospora zamorensis]